MEKKKQEETQISPKIIQKRERIVLSWTKPKRKRETKQKKKKIRKPKLTTTKKILIKKETEKSQKPHLKLKSRSKSVGKHPEIKMGPYVNLLKNLRKEEIERVISKGRKKGEGGKSESKV